VLAKIGEWMQLLGILTASTSNGGQSAPSNHQIKKLKRKKVKALQKKHYKGGSKLGKPDEASDDLFPKQYWMLSTKQVGITLENTSVSFSVVENRQPLTIVLQKVPQASRRKVKMMH
jgi:hypothetical protein